MKKIVFRITLDILLAISILNGWWIPALILVLIGLWIFPYFIEAIITGVAYDALFGMGAGMPLGGYEGTIACLALLLIISFGKRLIR